jgi:hypothetical protein
MWLAFGKNLASIAIMVLGSTPAAAAIYLVGLGLHRWSSNPAFTIPCPVVAFVVILSFWVTVVTRIGWLNRLIRRLS